MFSHAESLADEARDWGYTNHRDVVTSQRSTRFVMSALGLSEDTLVGERVLDLGSGFRQQLSRDLGAAGVSVISLDPNLPHDDDYVVQQMLNDLQVDASFAGGAFEALDFIEAAQAIRRKIHQDPESKKEAATAYREQTNWPERPYGLALAARAQELPFQDRTFDRIIATTSVPYGIQMNEIPRVLAECNRVLRKGGTAHFWPVVCGGIENYLKLDEIRQLVKQACAAAPSQVARRALSGFGLEVLESQDETWTTGMAAVGSLTGRAWMRSRALVLTRKAA